MKKQLQYHLMEYFKQAIPKFRTEYFERQRQFDKVIIWLTALSTASIALLITKSGSLVISNVCFLKATVAFLLLNVVSGAIFRVFLYPLEQLQSDQILYIESYCHGATFEITRPRELQETDTIEDIAKYLKTEFGVDRDHWLGEVYLNREFWVTSYNGCLKVWEDSEQDGLKALGRAIAPMVNKKPEESENLLLKPSNANENYKKYSRLLLTCKLSYAAAIIFFTLAVITIGLGYIFETNF